MPNSKDLSPITRGIYLKQKDGGLRRISEPQPSLKQQLDGISKHSLNDVINQINQNSPTAWRDGPGVSLLKAKPGITIHRTKLSVRGKHIITINNLPELTYQNALWHLCGPKNPMISLATKREYAYRIIKFFEFLEERPYLDDDILMHYRAWLDAKDYKPTTKNKYFLVAKQYFKLLFGMRLINKDLTEVHGRPVRAFKTGVHIKNGVSPEEMEQITDALRKSDDLVLKVIIALMYCNGLRVSEVHKLNWGDIDFKDKIMTIKAKGGKLDKAPINNSVIKLLKDLQRASDKKIGAVITGKGKRLQVNSIQVKVKRFLNSLGINRSCHDFRHLFITTLTRNFKAINQSMMFSRHQSTTGIQPYIDTWQMEKDVVKFNKFLKLDLSNPKT